LALHIPTQDPHEFRRVRVQVCRLTQAELAEALQMTQQTISRYERGILVIPVSAALALEALARRHRGGVRDQMQWNTVSRRASWRKLKETAIA
jgi:transcriptional regulator with XRE-family HTH domain